MDSAAIVCSSSPFHLSAVLNNGSTVLYLQCCGSGKKDEQWLYHICLKKMVIKPRPLDHRSKTQAFGKMTNERSLHKTQQKRGGGWSAERHMNAAKSTYWQLLQGPHRMLWYLFNRLTLVYLLHYLCNCLSADKSATWHNMSYMYCTQTYYIYTYS